jgi:NADH-quinone oxidoreductase subunit D/NADH-quinone oxidoreductase subunit C/D
VYGEVKFDEVTAGGGDCYSRYLVRMQEMRQSVSIIEQLIDNIPEGEFLAKTKAVLKLPKGEFYSRVETARGEFGVYIISEGGTTPYRIKFRGSRIFRRWIIWRGGIRSGTWWRSWGRWIW